MVALKHDGYLVNLTHGDDLNQTSLNAGAIGSSLMKLQALDAGELHSYMLENNYQPENTTQTCQQIRIRMADVEHNIDYLNDVLDYANFGAYESIERFQEKAKARGVTNWVTSKLGAISLSDIDVDATSGRWRVSQETLMKSDAINSVRSLYEATRYSDSPGHDAEEYLNSRVPELAFIHQLLRSYDDPVMNEVANVQMAIDWSKLLVDDLYITGNHRRSLDTTTIGKARVGGNQIKVITGNETLSDMRTAERFSTSLQPADDKAWIAKGWLEPNEMESIVRSFTLLLQGCLYLPDVVAGEPSLIHRLTSGGLFREVVSVGDAINKDGSLGHSLSPEYAFTNAALLMIIGRALASDQVELKAVLDTDGPIGAIRCLISQSDSCGIESMLSAKVQDDIAKVLMKIEWSVAEKGIGSVEKLLDVLPHSLGSGSMAHLSDSLNVERSQYSCGITLKSIREALQSPV